jgi:hypothetical protein
VTQQTESDTSRNGFLSYTGEYHAAAVGAGAGLTGALTLGTPLETIGVTAVGSVAAIALGIKGAGKLNNQWVVEEVHHESWYALGFMLIAFAFGLAATLLI